ncbi:hypothetical protein DBR44_13185 [Aquitalea sp. FJL05]|uniref:hypothetical protein n=1 Tax=Aquitalea sp. FJL05 TaxID=2153366 RepID=UPI000F590A75|nr:hypothetical protein [Aquitalea sp. FJL05]RQO69210.1 hypothetical protein DBR44_13185 [Aquitalea sp. FJL05]
MATISEIAYALRTASHATASPIKLSHAQQLVAAALGYKSLAAFQASPLEAPTLDEAAHFVLNGGLLADRASELCLPHQLSELAILLQQAFKARLPMARLHQSESGINDYIISLVDDVVVNDEAVAGQMASTNGDGIEEVYMPVDEFELASLPPAGQTLDIELEGHIAMGIDIERPYSGHIIKVEASLVIERTGKVSIAEPNCEVTKAQLDWSWGDDDYENEGSLVSLAEALADEFGLSIAEAEELVDAVATPNLSDDGLFYSYTFDFTQHASLEVAEKLMVKYGSLQLEVQPWFFDRVAHPTG